LSEPPHVKQRRLVKERLVLEKRQIPKHKESGDSTTAQTKTPKHNRERMEFLAAQQNLRSLTTEEKEELEYLSRLVPHERRLNILTLRKDRDENALNAVRNALHTLKVNEPEHLKQQRRKSAAAKRQVTKEKQGGGPTVKSYPTPNQALKAFKERVKGREQALTRAEREYQDLLPEWLRSRREVDRLRQLKSTRLKSGKDLDEATAQDLKQNSEDLKAILERVRALERTLAAPPVEGPGGEARIGGGSVPPAPGRDHGGDAGATGSGPQRGDAAQTHQPSQPSRLTPADGQVRGSAASAARRKPKRLPDDDSDTAPSGPKRRRSDS
jgi:hypothetical protein